MMILLDVFFKLGKIIGMADKSTDAVIAALCKFAALYKFAAADWFKDSTFGILGESKVLLVPSLLFMALKQVAHCFKSSKASRMQALYRKGTRQSFKEIA
jgi:hypothetical protein